MRPIAFFISLVVWMSSLPAQAFDFFIPHKGKYAYSIYDVEDHLHFEGVDYVTLDRSKSGINKLKFKHVKAKNEFQVENWFLQDWYKLQDNFKLDASAFLDKYRSSTFNEAKRKQYSEFAFHKSKFFHKKTIPSLKEWGGLTHPPFKKLSSPLSQYDHHYKKIDYKKVGSPFFNPSLQKELDSLSRSELTFGNVVRAYADHEAFDIKLDLINRAKESILMSSLAFACDKSSRLLVQRLVAKKRQGVDVKVMVDAMISKVLKMKECVYLMRAGGIEVVETTDFFKHKKKAIYHVKTLVVDFKEAVAGGHNMHDAENTSRTTDFKNRDVDLYIKGPMVTDIAKQFVENWNYQVPFIKGLKKLTKLEERIHKDLALQRKQAKRGEKFYQKILSNKNQRMSGVCRFIKQAPYEDRHTIGKAYLKIMDNVKNYLVITNPINNDTYTPRPAFSQLGNQFDNFDMYNLLFKKLQTVAKSNIDIDYITTSIDMAGNEQVPVMNEAIAEQLEHSQELRAYWSLMQLVIANRYFGKPHYKYLIKDWMPYKKMRIWNNISFLHSKILYADRILASVGSYNFHHNSTDQAYEATAICMDERLNKDLDYILVQDMVNSIPLIYKK